LNCASNLTFVSERVRMIEVATRTSNPRSRGERTKRRQRHL